MKVSKWAEVGQIRRRRGISMKRMMKAETLLNVVSAVSVCAGRRGRYAYRQMMLKRITQWNWKMLAMPSAKQRTMQSTPILV